MGKIGYSFDGGKRAVKPRRKSNGARNLIIFILLIIFCSGAYFMFIRSADEKPVPKSEQKAPGINIPSPEEKVNISELKITPGSEQPVKPVPAIEKPVSPLPVIKPSAKPAIPIELTELCKKSGTALDSHEYVKAREYAQKALQLPGVTKYSSGWLKAAEALSAANSLIISSDVPMPGKKVRYKVEAGDALQKIANKFNTTVELIQRSNNMKSTNYVVWEGQGLKIYRGEWKIIISKKHRLLSLYDGDELFKIYHIGIGRQDRTPECKFKIVAKKKNPSWYKSKGEIIPFGTKENVLGTRWIALQATDEKFKHLSGYGIHGTWDNDSIGKAMSNGCIRMKNNEVEELFAIVTHGTKVLISGE